MRVVKVSHYGRWSVWGVDLSCGAVVAALACSALWLLVNYIDRSGQELTDKRKALSSARQTLATLQVANASQQAAILQQTTDLIDRGTLPSQFPTGSYFQDLTLLATEAGVTIQSQIPMVAAEYPGLVEARSQFEISGSLQAILTFFDAIERSTYWADVGFFSLAQGGGADPSSRDHSAKFTISMFSSRSSDGDLPKDGSS